MLQQSVDELQKVREGKRPFSLHGLDSKALRVAGWREKRRFIVHL